MARLTKEEQKAIAQLERWDREEGVSHSSAVKKAQPKTAKVTRKLGRPKKVVVKVPKPAIVEAAEPGGEVGVAVQRRVPKKPNKRGPTAADLMKLLEKISATLASSSSSQDVGDVLRNNGFEDAEAIGTLYENCQAISSLLSALMNVKKRSQIPSTIQYYSKVFVLRDRSSRVFVLNAYEVFQGKHPYNRNKVLGWVQHKGTQVPLRFTLPGYSLCADQHPKLLDSEKWTAQVLKWAKNHNHEFSKYMYDGKHKKPPGTTYASHCEPRLTLWYACEMTAKLFGITDPGRDILADIWQLSTVKDKIEADLVLTEAPCTHCWNFIEIIQRATKIKFTVLVVPNLGHLKPTKNKKNQKQYPLDASDSEDVDEETEDVNDEESEDGEEGTGTVVEDGILIGEKQIFRRSNLTVEIPRKLIIKPSSKNPIQEEETTSNSQNIPVNREKPTRTPSQIIKSFRRVETTEETRYSHQHSDSDNESEWLPGPRSKTLARQYSTPVKQSRNQAPPTPDSDPFDWEARRFTDRLKTKTKMTSKKRPVPVLQDFTTPSKKKRWEGYPQFN